MKRMFIVLIFLLGVLLRFLLLGANANYPGASHPATALVAKHIMLGKSLPLTYPIVHYGDILRCYIGALIFKIFGISLVKFTIGIIFVYSIPAIIFVYFLTKQLSQYKNTAIFALLFMSLPPVMVNFYYLHQLAICFIPLILFLSYLINFEEDRFTSRQKNYMYSILGLVLGVGLWNEIIILPYVIIPILFLFRQRKNTHFRWNFSLFLIFAIIGCLPYIIYNLIHPFATIMRMGGLILRNVERSALQEPDAFFILLKAVWERILYIPTGISESLYYLHISIGLGKLKSGNLAWLNLLTAAIYFSSFLYLLYIRGKVIFNLLRLRFSQLSGIDMILFTMVFGYLASTILGAYSYNRMIISYPIIVFFVSIFTAYLWQKSKIIALAAITVLLSVNLSGNILALGEPLTPYRSLVSFLENKRIYGGYSNDTISYMVTFISEEKVIILPTASTEDVGFVEIGVESTDSEERVRRVSRICYIFNLEKHSSPIRIMHQKLMEKGITCKNKILYPFYIFYDFSRVPLPRELNLPSIRIRFKQYKQIGLLEPANK